MSKTFDAVINANLSWNFFSQMNYSFSVFKLYVSNEMSCTGMPFFGHWVAWYENYSFMNKSICTAISSKYNMHISRIHSLSIIKTYVNTSIPHNLIMEYLFVFKWSPPNWLLTSNNLTQANPLLPWYNQYPHYWAL